MQRVPPQQLCSETQRKEQARFRGAYLSPLRPEGWIQLPVGQEAVLQAGQELQQVPSSGEPQRGPLNPVLAHQDNRATAVYY